MPPKPTTPRLADIDADALAKEICTKLRRHVESALSVMSSRSLEERPPALFADLRSMPMYAKVKDLVRFAQTGQGEYVTTLLQRFTEVYYGSASSPSGPCHPLGEEDPIATVVLAAQARVDLARGLPVEHRALAALAGVHTSRIRQLSGGKKPVLPRAVERGRLEAVPARRWLAAQKVPGFEAPPKQRGVKGRVRSR